MSTICRKGIVLIAVSLFCSLLFSQETELSKTYKQEVISTLSTLLIDRYVFPEIAEETASYLEKELDEGQFDSYTTHESFAERLTQSVQFITKDKHLKIWSQPPYVAPPMTPERFIEEKLFNTSRTKNYNAGFNAVKVMDGNVGYLDLRGFTRFTEGKSVADAYMKLISNTDAVIIDLSKNGGGDPEMVQYLCSYFFDGGVHLNSLYFRQGDRTVDFFTLDEVGGRKMQNVPLFVITSEKTFSGAEEFSYNMQTQKRATLIGQTTGGGANPGGTGPINEHLSVFIPGGRAINPITKTNWEGTGVIPDIKVGQEIALQKAHELAQAAAEQYKGKIEEQYTTRLQQLFEELDKNEVSEKIVLDKLRNLTDDKIFQEWEINALGYQYMLENKKLEAAKAILKANTILYPLSPNAYDSFGESLLNLGQYEESIKNYKKSVALAKESNSPDLEMYEENLAKALNQNK